MKQSTRCSILLVAFGVLAVSDEARAHEGWGIVVDARGRVVFTDIPANTVWRVDEHGRLRRLRSLTHSHALVLAGDGSLYGSDVHLTQPIGSVWRLGPDDEPSFVLPPTRGLPFGLQSFVIAPDSTIYSASTWDQQARQVVLLRRTPDGRVHAIAGGPQGHADGRGGAARFVAIDGMALLADGSLLVVDGPYLRRVTAMGVVTTLPPGALTRAAWDEDLLGVAPDGKAGAYVADHARRRVLHVAADGRARAVVSTGTLWAPTGVAVSERGLYVLEHLRLPLAILGDLQVGPYARVERVLQDGRRTTVVLLWGSRSWAAAAGLGLLAVLVVLTVRRFSRRRRV